MTIAFTPCSGAVHLVERCEGSNQKLFSIKVEGAGPLVWPITAMSLELTGNYQFLHTVNNFVYFYSFGDRVGQLVVGGIGFVGQCDGDPKSGILALYDYYMKNRAVKRKGKAFNIILDDVTGTATLKGFLTGVQLSVNSDNVMGVMGHWSLRFDVLPEEPSGGGEWMPPLSTPQLRGWANTA